MANAPKAVKSDAAQEWEWKVEGAARSLQDAMEVQADAKLHAAALVLMKKQRTALDKAIGQTKGATYRRRK